MWITLRLVVALSVVTATGVFFSANLQIRQEEAYLKRELERRASVLAESFQEAVEPLVTARNSGELRRLVQRFENRERLAGVALYGADGRLLTHTPTLPTQFQQVPPIAQEAMGSHKGGGTFWKNGTALWHLQALPLRHPEGVMGALVLFHDASYIAQYRLRIWRQNFARLLLHVFLITLATFLVVRWSLLRPIARTVEWIKRVRGGDWTARWDLPKANPFAPLAREVTQMARSLRSARLAAGEEARLRLAAESRWTAERLKEHVRMVLQGNQLLMISNREPYQHVWQGRQAKCIVPASGLVTAVEPILRACGGTWIAHGSGEADRENSDSNGKLRVPPYAPVYTLKRVWLSKEEEEGHYYGFSNEGLWPLCHIAHTRPIFRAADWAQYQRVNAKFADALEEELGGIENPYVLIQDYHFALLPRMIKERHPDAKIALFWHIPWPNPEAFGICPWARELLHGMLGADLMGFHIQFHCNNFLDTVDRMLESRIDWENFSVNQTGHTTWVKPFPISIAADEFRESETEGSSARGMVLKGLGIDFQRLGVGVDRIDYTKGITERFKAIERFFERYPDFVGRFVFAELGAPSRTPIKRYNDLSTELDQEVERINRRFQTRTWRPIVFLKRHHSHAEIAPFLQTADVCLVTSLHDGMNLVAKEFVAARGDEKGVLILSQFAGASRELRDALLINPYDTDQVAKAIHDALIMSQQDQKARMSRMRKTIQEHNVYRWAANLVAELAQIRPEAWTDAAAAATET